MDNATGRTSPNLDENHPRTRAEKILLAIVIFIFATSFLLAARSANAGSIESAAKAGSLLQERPIHSLTGQPTRIEIPSDQPVVLNFWASWCVPCRKELPVLDDLYLSYGDQVTFVAVSIDRRIENARDLAKKLGLHVPLYHDGPEGLAALFDPPHLPCTYVIDQGAGSVGVFSGSGPEDLARLRSAIAAVASSTPSGQRAEGGSR